MANERLIIRVHAIKRMARRRIGEADIRHVLQTGETIKTYPHDKPYPSRLVLGWRDERPLHVVVAENSDDAETIVITVYEPDPQEWDGDFRRRKSI